MEGYKQKFKNLNVQFKCSVENNLGLSQIKEPFEQNKLYRLNFDDRGLCMNLNFTIES